MTEKARRCTFRPSPVGPLSELGREQIEQLQDQRPAQTRRGRRPSEPPNDHSDRKEYHQIVSWPTESSRRTEGGEWCPELLRQLQHYAGTRRHLVAHCITHAQQDDHDEREQRDNGRTAWRASQQDPSRDCQQDDDPESEIVEPLVTDRPLPTESQAARPMPSSASRS